MWLVHVFRLCVVNHRALFCFQQLLKKKIFNYIVGHHIAKKSYALNDKNGIL